MLERTFMDVSGMLSNGAQDAGASADTRRMNHQYPTRHATTSQDRDTFAKPYPVSAQRYPRANGTAAGGSGYPRGSPAKKDQKQVVFQLIDPEDSRIQARLPMRVMISTHDATDSIITTVKNFYGLYEYGVSFENKDSISIIAAYDNFENDMTVYVRTVAHPGAEIGDNARPSISPKKPSLAAPFELRPAQLNATQSPSRSAARSAGMRSMSPQSDIGRRSVSAAPGGKPRPQRTTSKDNSVVGDGEGYSSGDNGGGSVTSSRRSKTEQVSAEISVENIVEGGRRKRAFESSELPLFVPPQVPISASISSISPQRRSGPPNTASPYAVPNQRTFSYTQPLPSPQSYGNGAIYTQSSMAVNGQGNPYPQQNRQLRHGRPTGITYPANRHSSGGILPTPDPTVGSVISDEDVALQLMRLGDPMAFSYGRTSTSTVDDALSGKADAASSDEEDEEDEDQDEEEEGEDSALPTVPHYPKGDMGPQRKKQRMMNEHPSDGAGGEEYEDRRDGTFAGSEDMSREHDAQQRKKMKSSKPRNSLPPLKTGSGKPRAYSMATKPHTSKGKPLASSSGPFAKVPMSPSSMPAPSRKASLASTSTINFHHPLGADEEDLSSQPRCQRCRKSKKGCDRQRPCGRCKDAGIGIDGCISEDEGNGRKGRYGRHMGVSIKKEEDAFGGAASESGTPVLAPQQAFGSPAQGYFLAPALPDKSKKRKR